MKGIRSKLNLVLTIVAFFMLSLQGFSQACDTTCSPNFVPNGSLENTTISCSDTTSEMHTDYSQVTGWFGTAPINGTGSTPDYYNTNCNGPSQTNTCDASSGSVGFFTYAIQGANAREYVQTQLITPLVAGQEYCMSFDIKLGNNSSYLPSDGLGVWFTNQMVDIDAQNGGAHFIGPGSTINATPQIENPTGNMIDTNCTIFTANFIATGTEQWMVIGNFKNDANTQLTGSCFFGLCFSYFIIDNVSLRTTCTTQPLDITATTTNDTICNNECTNIEAIVTGGTTPYNITWNNGVPNGVGPHNVCPTTTTTYIATVTDSLNNTDTSSITIYVNPTDSNYSAISICANDSVFAGGAWQNTTGMYYDTLQNTYGCDSLLVTDLTVTPSDAALFNYPQNNYCITDANPTPTITGTVGGTFTINNSGTINSSTGEINIASSGVGTFNITYTTNGTCPDTNTVTITIVSSGDATITPAGPFCENNAATTLTAAQSGGVWSGNGITNTSTGVFDPSTAGVGTHQIIYTISGSCGDADTISITVNAQDDASFNYSSTVFCSTDANPTPTITGAIGGTFTINNSGTINSSTGEINIALSGVGTFNITYTTNGTCPDTNTVTITIVSSGDATITPAGPFCENDAATTLTSAQAGGVWSGNGITNTSTGVFDPSTAGVGTHQIIYTISGSCGDADTITITINAQDDASFNYNSTVYCSTDANPTPTITGTVGGTFTIDNSGTINASSGEINIASSGVGTFNITYITNGACPDTNTVSIIINNCTNPVANFIVSDTSICKNECITITDASSNATSWQWTFNGGNPASANTAGPHTVCFATVGTYTITLISTNSNGSDTATTSITVHDNPTVDAGTDVVIDLGQSTLLNAIGSNGSYTWTPPTWLDCPTCPSTLSTPDETITYTVVVVDSNGCSASDDVTVIVDFEYVVWVPNIFSPNGDGNNDVVYVRGIGIDSFNFIVYNRWGEKVFETSDLNTGWDGTFRGEKLNSAVFVYYLEATFKNGTSTTKKGDITLIK